LCVVFGELYLEYAEEQDNTEYNHEELCPDDREVGDLHSCNNKKPSQNEMETTAFGFTPLSLYYRGEPPVPIG
jgi:hypothetical protein